MVNKFLNIMTQRLHKRAAVDFDTMKKLKAAGNTGSTGEVWINDLAVQ
jgi:hypothetical protein